MKTGVASILLEMPGAGFEPARIYPRDFKSLASASFAIRTQAVRFAAIQYVLSERN